MLRNYFKIAWRNLLRNKVFSFINIFGLAIGIAVCLIISLFIINEWSYDRFNENADRIVRVTLGGKMSGEIMKEPFVMPPIAKILKNNFPEIVDASRLMNNFQTKVSYQDKTFEEPQSYAIDPNFFSLFTVPFIKGDPKTALANPGSVVISETFAKKCFGKEDPMGKVLTFQNGNFSRKVMGVMKDIPTNASFHTEIFTSLTDDPNAKLSTWMEGTYYTYLLLPKGYDWKKLEAKFPPIVEKYLSPQLKQAMGMNLSEFRSKGNNIGLYLQPLTDIHLHSSFNNDLEPNGDIRYVYIFGAIALFMLLIACINFMNLSTASASKRSKEVGIRKVLGSFKSDLMKQFLFESLLMTIIAMTISLILVKLAIPFFNELANKKLTLDLLAHPLGLIGIALMALLVGILAGSYPAFFLSSFKPIEVLKNKFISNKKGISLRSVLVVFQFSISVLLIIGTLVVYKQLSFIQNKKLGYEKDQVIVLRNTYLLGNNESVLKQQLLNDPRILNVSNSSFLPAGPTNDNMTTTFPDGNRSFSRRTNIYEVDEQYIPTMGMEIKTGRNFSPNFPTDSSAVIVNETTAKLFGWGNSIVGHTVNFYTDNEGHSKSLNVLGIVKDFNFKSLHHEIDPLIMVLKKGSGLILKVKPNDIANILSTIKSKWSTFNVGEPLQYSFLNEDFARTYSTEQKTGTIVFIFAGLTILVACLGLFGLATYTADQRTKEIGIRKTLGASVGQIVGLLSNDFIKLVLIACLIAFPLSWWAMSKWLQDFAYRTNISWWIFLIAGTVALLIALFTVSFQAIKAAVANPVKSLRTE